MTTKKLGSPKDTATLVELMIDFEIGGTMHPVRVPRLDADNIDKESRPSPLYPNPTIAR